MKLIVGLGNQGIQYENTRHNIGFLFIEWLKNNFGIYEDFKEEKKFKGEILEFNIGNEKCILLKPLTFVNLSGESIIKFLSFYKIKKEDFIVIYDDISMEFGKIRLREKGSAGGQNGIKNIILHIGEEFKRIKIGIGENKNYELSDWVLSKFTLNEMNELENDVFPKVKELLLKNL